MVNVLRNLVALALATPMLSAQSPALFSDDVERGLAEWEIHGVNGVSVQPLRARHTPVRRGA